MVDDVRKGYCQFWEMLGERTVASPQFPKPYVTNLIRYDRLVPANVVFERLRRLHKSFCLQYIISNKLEISLVTLFCFFPKSGNVNKCY